MNPIIRRDHYLQKLIDRKENGLIKVITGIRRCGKSFLLFDLFYDHLIESGVREEQIIPIALDDDMFTKYRDPDELSRFIRSKIVSKEMYYILIDEVQYAIAKDELKDPESIRLYNVLNGLMRLRNVDIYVTGSNSKMLTKDVLTVFRAAAMRSTFIQSRSGSIMPPLAETRRRHMKSMPCMAGCRWSCPEKRMQTRWPTCRACLRRSTSRISPNVMTLPFRTCSQS